MSFIIEWITFYAAIMFAMSVDNIFWIPTSPEYAKIKAKKYPITIDNRSYKTLFSYVLGYRVWTVLTHWRDIVPAIITSFILAVIL